MTLGSKISTTLVVSVAVVGTVGVRPHAPLRAEEVRQTVSTQFRKPLEEAHADLKAQKYADAISKLKAAEAIRGKAPYDQHLINDFLSYAYVRTADYADAAKTMEVEVDDGFTPPADQSKKVRALAALNYQLKDYDKAIEYGRRAINGGHGDDDMQKVVGQAYYLKGDWKSTIDFEDDLVTAQIRRGETPAKESLLLLYSACVKLQEKECATRALERLNRYSPGPWRPNPITPQVPLGGVLAYFFGPPLDVEDQKRPPTSQDESKKAK